MAAFPRLLGVFYAEFHPVQGPRIAFQWPPGLMASDLFDAMSEYLIPKPQLCGRLVSLCTDRERVMTMPVSIESNRYERNALLFNVGFVFAVDDDATCYEPVVRKVAKTLRALEVERHFLSTDGKPWLEGALPDLVDDLNKYHEFHISTDHPPEAPGRSGYLVSLNLKLFPTYQDPGPVLDHEVPVLTTPLHEYVSPTWDLTTRRVLPYVDGVNYVRRIAAVSDIDVHLVRECLQNLRYYGAIHMIDIFQFANVYALTDVVHRLYTDEHLQHECSAYIRLDGPTERRAAPGINVIFAAYASFRHGTSVADVVGEGRLVGVNIDVRHLVTFGVVRGVLRRVHTYAVRPGPAGAATEAPPTPGGPGDLVRGSAADAAAVLARRLRRLTVQPRKFDELCVALGINVVELEAALANDPEVQIYAR